MRERFLGRQTGFRSRERAVAAHRLAACRARRRWFARRRGGYDAGGVPGTGLVGFAAFVFDDVSASTSTIIVPPVIVGRRKGRAWITHITRVDEEADAGGTGSREGGAASATAAVAQPAASATPYGPHWSGTVGPGALDPDAHQAAVRRALDVIAAGGAEKVVVARDLVGTVPAGSDLRRLPRALSTGYPDCWTFAVDGLIGSSWPRFRHP